MLLARRLSVVCAALALTGPAVARGEPAPAAAPVATGPSEQVPEDSPPVAAEAALDVILPCGLRVLAARDVSLPVAAVVLAVEVGFEDDPPEYPGLVHALAYHLYQGNRELRPGEAIAAAQDAGGVHLLATGPGQIRFESLVPISSLPDVLFAESQRLRSPTIDRSRWDISLGWAAADAKLPTRFRAENFALLHGAPGLAHDGRAVSRNLSGMVLGSISAQLAGKFTYNRSTLIVVAPEDPAETLKKVAERFADLPPSQRQVPARAPAPARPPLPASTATPGTPPADPGKAAALAPTTAPAEPGMLAGRALSRPAAPDAETAVPGMPAGSAPSLASTPGRAPSPSSLPAADSGTPADRAPSLATLPSRAPTPTSLPAADAGIPAGRAPSLTDAPLAVLGMPAGRAPAPTSLSDSNSVAPLAVLGMPAVRAFSLAPAPKTGPGTPAAPATDPGKPAPADSGIAPADSGPPAPPPQTQIRYIAWPVPPDNAAAGWAGAICRALNRQKREASEPRNARMVCDYEPDPRRGALLLRPVGVDDPVEFVRARLARLSGSDAALLSQQAAVVAQATRLRVRTPLGLARQLAASPPLPADPPPGDAPLERPLDTITGLAALADRPALALSVETALLLGTEVPK